MSITDDVMNAAMAKWARGGTPNFKLFLPDLTVQDSYYPWILSLDAPLGTYALRHSTEWWHRVPNIRGLPKIKWVSILYESVPEQIKLLHMIT
jgi:hypothetical protein